MRFGRQEILIVEPDEATARTYERILRSHYRVRTTSNAAEGLREIESSRPDAVIAALRMPGVDGLEFLRRLRARDDRRTLPVAIVTGDYSVEITLRLQLKQLGAEVRFKPLWTTDLMTLIEGLLAGPQ